MSYRFTLTRMSRDPSGYYNTRWDLGTPITVIAETEKDAVKKANTMSGPVYGGRHGDVWGFRVDRIDEIEGEGDDA